MKKCSLNHTLCGKTKVTEISALLFCKVFIATTVYLFYIIVWHIAYECWVCVNNYGFHNRGEGFIFEHYFWSYRVGRQNGPSLHHVREHYEEQFNKMAPSNKTILAIVEKFTVRDQS